MTATDLSALSDSARAAVIEFVRVLADKTFVGKVEADCSQGGVMNFKVTRNIKLARAETAR